MNIFTFSGVKEIPKHIEVQYPRIPRLTARDYSKEKIGKLQPIYRTETHAKSIVWLTQCDCGEYLAVRADNLKKKKITACRSCSLAGYKTWRQEGVPQWVLDKYPEGPQGMSSDRYGEVYGKLTVVYRTKKTSEPHWVCKCECGNYEEVPINYLVRRIKGICSVCMDKKTNNFSNSEYKDLPGERISEELLQEYKDSMPQDLKEKWPEIPVGGASNIAGQEFTWLTALYRTHSSTSNHTFWVFRCRCGNYTRVRSGYVANKSTGSCGCKSSSLGEDNIAKLLEENSIKYKREYIFKDHQSNYRNGESRYDFAVFNNNELTYVIEFDGRQHFEEVDMFGLTLKEQRMNDKIKNSFCYREGIPIIRIPYWKRDTITFDMLQPKTSKYVWPWAAEVLEEGYEDDGKSGYVLKG